MISLTEVFLLEDSRGALKSQFGFSSELADYFHSLDSKNSFALGKIFFYQLVDADNSTTKSTKKKVSSFDSKEAKYQVDRLFSVEKFKEYVKALKNNNMLAKNIKKATTFADIFLPLEDEIKKMNAKSDSKNRLFDAGNGLFWVDLKRSDCRVEADAMGHCGNDNRGTLVSLRDKNNKPHVTLTWNKARNEVFQIKGKQNDIPHEKYWDAVKVFFDKTKAKFADQELVDKWEDGENEALDLISFLLGNDWDPVKDFYEEPVKIDGNWSFVNKGPVDNDGTDDQWVSYHNGREGNDELTYAEIHLDPKTNKVNNIMNYRELPPDDDRLIDAIMKFLNKKKVKDIEFDHFWWDYTTDEESYNLLRSLVDAGYADSEILKDIPKENYYD